jgi:hypothetical protein
MDPKPKPTKDESGWRQAGIALTIPWLLLSGPITGFLLAIGINWLFKVGEPWDGRIKIIMILVCTFAGIREAYKLLKRMSAEKQ